MKKLLIKIKSISVAFLMLFFVQTNFLSAQENSKEEKVYVKIEVKGMACAYCAFGMEKELKKVTGVDSVVIELEEGMIYISTPKSQKPAKERLSLIIQNAGFTPGSIEYGNKPFNRVESK